MRHVNIPIFIPHEGCPNHCVFCNQQKISGQTRAPSVSEAEAIIEGHLQTIHEDDICEIAFFGGNFTGLPIERQTRYLSLAEQYVKEGKVHAIRLSTRPDDINQTVLKHLSLFSVKTIELGIQSLDDEVLHHSCRGYTGHMALEACRLVKQFGFSLGVQMMIGLPGDTLSKSKCSANRIIRIKPDMVRIYPTLVIRGTELEALYKKGEYQPLSLDEAVEWCSQLIPLYEDAQIQVLRIGLQHSEEIRFGSDVLAGPVHPSFGELVRSRGYLNQLVEILHNLHECPDKNIVIHVHPTRVSCVVGHQRKNIQLLKERYMLSEIKVIGDQKEKSSLQLRFGDGRVFPPSV